MSITITIFATLLAILVACNALITQAIKVAFDKRGKKYSSNLEYARLEELAMKNKVGLWSDPNAVSPWSYRK